MIGKCSVKLEFKNTSVCVLLELKCFVNITAEGEASSRCNWNVRVIAMKILEQRGNFRTRMIVTSLTGLYAKRVARLREVQDVKSREAASAQNF